MGQQCMTYKQIAEILQIAPNTFRKTWRQYPHFFVTPPSTRPQGGNLKSARFDPVEVLNYAKQGRYSRYGYQHDTVEDVPSVRGKRQSRWYNTQEALSDAPRSKNMGVGDEASPSNGSTALFDVFAGL